MLSTILEILEPQKMAQIENGYQEDTKLKNDAEICSNWKKLVNWSEPK